MSRKDFGAKPYIFPMPVLIIGSYDENNIPDAMNVAYGGIVNNNHIQININKNHQTAHNIKQNRAFTVNVATVDTVEFADYVGIVSGKDNPDKLKKVGMSVFRSLLVDAPILEDFPICLECIVEEINELGSTLKIVGTILNTAVEENILNDFKEIDPEKLQAITYDPVQQTYIALGKKVADAFKVGNKLITPQE